MHTLKTKGLDGHTYVWNLAEYHNKQNTNPSSHHVRCRELLLQIYINDVILEEVTLPDVNLKLDFYLSRQFLAIEVQGEAHYQYVGHFHKHRIGYAGALKRDSTKREWCELNRITLIELPHYEDNEKWKQRIIHRQT